jgi:hypothetical protein
MCISHQEELLCRGKFRYQDDQAGRRERHGRESASAWAKNEASMLWLGEGRSALGFETSHVGSDLRQSGPTRDEKDACGRPTRQYDPIAFVMDAISGIRCRLTADNQGAVSLRAERYGLLANPYA